jgi:hypothetical protein
MPTTTSTVAAATALLATALMLTGCSSSEPYEYSAPAAAPVATAAQGAEEKTAAAAQLQQPPRPAGSVPRPVLGIWHGGQDNRTDYTFIVASAGEYELDHKATPALPAFVEKGWIVGDSGRILLRPVLVDGVRTQERIATWSKLPNSVGIDILVVSDPLFGELTYVPADR